MYYAEPDQPIPELLESAKESPKP